MRRTHLTRRIGRMSAFAMGAELAIAVDTTIHELEVVKRVCYSMSDRYAIELERTGDSSLNAKCRAKVGVLPPEFADSFQEKLIDYGIRATLSRETAAIRDLIYRQAFIEADL